MIFRLPLLQVLLPPESCKPPGKYQNVFPKQTYFVKIVTTETFGVTNQRKCKNPECVSEYELLPLTPETNTKLIKA